jgi:para-nitrobenzyl esterase
VSVVGTRFLATCIVAAATFLAVVVPSAFGASTPGSAEPPVLVLHDGPILGTVADGVRIFKGIPYAAPPVGELRFAPPVEPIPWAGTLDCTSFAPNAPQTVPDITGGRLTAGDEDCLRLNVWTPEGARGLPVYFWVHGGGDGVGGPQDPRTDGTRLAKEGIVVVSIAYRLNVPGFLASREAFRRYGTTGNWGLLDQIKALEWVRDNIAVFGGDPGRVTIGGQSAGAFNVSGLLLSPPARGLFHGAIMESGSVLSMPLFVPVTNCDLERTMAAHAAIFGLFGARDDSVGLERLRAAPVEMLVGLAPILLDCNITTQFVMSPVLDGRVLPKDPWMALAQGDFARVPIFLGYNADEASAFVRYSTPALYKAMALRMYGGRGARLALARHPLDEGHDALSRMRELQTFGIFQAGMKGVMDAYSAYGNAVYAYRYARVAEGDRMAGLGAAHTREMPLFFGTSAMDAKDPLARDMFARYANFIRTGDPNVGAKVDVVWPRYDPEDRAMLRFDDPPAVEPMPDAADLDFHLEAAERAFHAGGEAR